MLADKKNPKKTNQTNKTAKTQKKTKSYFVRIGVAKL
jgi:hypothetical protein